MIIKKYIVSNMSEAMTRIRYELGRDAVIISQRKIRKPGFKGLFSKKVIEVTAAVESASKNDNKSVNESIEAIKRVMENTNTENYNFKNFDDEVKKSELKKEDKKISEVGSLDIFKEMQEMKNMINEMMEEKIPSIKELQNEKTELQIQLESKDINDIIVKNIISQVDNMDVDISEIDKVKKVISDMINVNSSKEKLKGTVVFVGPTGVGKTTTIAKLAGKLALIEKKNVGLITIDTYRIGAVEQLRTYAQIMNISFKVVLTIKEMEDALESMKDCDTVLIDTTGRSSKNTMQISELRAFIEKANTDNIHLVISSTTKDKDVDSIVQGYKDLNYNNIIITKLDETTTYGSILNILEYTKKPISYITTGQDVPDDIEDVNINEIVNLIMGEDCKC